MPRRQQRKHTRIHHSQPPRPKSPAPYIHHSHGIVRPPHLTRTNGMIDRIRTPFHNLLDLRIRLDRQAGERFLADAEPAHGLRGPELADAFEARDRDGEVRGVGEPVWVDKGSGGRVGGGDGEIAAGQGGDDGGGEGGVVVPVVGVARGEVLLITQVGAQGEIFEFGPIGGESGERGKGLRGEGGTEGVGDFVPGEDVGGGVGVEARCVFVEVLGGLGGEGGVGERGEGRRVNAVGGAEVDVVLHVLADAGAVGDDGDAVLAEGWGGSYSGNHEELRGTEDTSGEDDLFGCSKGVLFALVIYHDSCGRFITVE